MKVLFNFFMVRIGCILGATSNFFFLINGSSVLAMNIVTIHRPGHLEGGLMKVRARAVR